MTHKRLPVIWLNGSQFEAARVAGTFVGLKKGFFQHHQFLVLPYAAPKSIYLPDIDHSLLLSHNLPDTYHPEEYKKEILSVIEEHLKKDPNIRSVSSDELQKQFLSIQKDLDTSLQHLFSTIYQTISTITIITTHFGTEGSFDYKKVGNSYNLYIWIRDTGLSKEEIIAHLVHCLVSAFVLVATKVSDTNTVAWKQREAIIDFLLEHTELQMVWKNIQKTVPVIESKQKSQRMVSDSQIFLKKLQFTLSPPNIVKKKNGFTIDTVVLENLSESETILLSILFNHRNHYVNKDVLFDALYGSDGASDWALSKLVQRLRNKIVKIGIEYPILVTSRKKGYKLISS